jgi:hypothetical protein
MISRCHRREGAAPEKSVQAFKRKPKATRIEAATAELSGMALL